MKVNCTTILTTAAVSALTVGGLAYADQVGLTTSGVDGRPVTAPQPIGTPCGDGVLTQSADPKTIGTGTVQCAGGSPQYTTANGLGRSFSVENELAVCAVQFGIQTNINGDWPLTVNLYEGNITGAFGDLDHRGASTVVIPDGAGPELFIVHFDPPVKFLPGENMVVELFHDSRNPADGGDGGALWPASNDLGETAPSYIRAEACGIANFITYASIGFPDVHLAIKVFVGPNAGTDCPGDINGDGVVDVSDLLALLAAWGPCADPNDCPADINEDGVVDVSDLLALLAAWGPCPGPPPATGACCFDDGSCVPDLTGDECDDINGNYAGNFSNCAVCPQPPDGTTCALALDIAVGQTIDENTEGNPAPSSASCGGVTPSNEGGVWFKVDGTGTQLRARADTGAAGPGSAVAVYCNTCAQLVCVGGGTQNSGGDNPFDGEVTWCAGSGNTYYIVAWRTGADGDISMSLDEVGGSCTPTVDCEPPADDSCEGFCGSQTPSGCWCDEACCDFIDCCEDKFAVCGGCEPPPPPVCDDVNCQDTEGEPCGDDINGGCNSEPPVFSSIALGETVCGNAWADGGTRDTDWYYFTVTEDTSVSWAVQSEEEIAAIIVGGVDSCSPVVIDSAVGCDVVVTTCLTPGNYVAFVAPSVFDGFPCPGFTYEATLTGVPDTCAAGGECGQGFCGTQAPSGCWCDEDCCTFVDCCPGKFEDCGGCQP